MSIIYTPNKKVVQVKLIEYRSTFDLESDINEWLKGEWTLSGPVLVKGVFYAQLITKILEIES